MASAYLAQQQERQKALLQQLISKTLGVKAGEENYAIAWDFCTSNLNPRYHSYKDTDAKDIAVLYDELAGRFEQHSQLSKAKALRSRVQYLHDQLQGDLTGEVLRFLFNVAQRPLESQPGWLLSLEQHQLTHPPSKASVSHTKQYDRQGSVSERNDDSSLDDDADATWSASSDLSDWDDNHDVPAQSAQSVHSKLQSKPTTGSSSTHTPTPSTTEAVSAVAATQDTRIANGFGSMGGTQAYTAVPDVPVSRLECADPLIQHAQPQPNDLVPSIIKCRHREAAFMLPKEEHCLTDQYIVHQICNLVLFGNSACYTWQPGSNSNPSINSQNAAVGALGSLAAPDTYGGFQAMKGLYTPSLSQSIVADLLSSFARLGNQLTWVRALVTCTNSSTLGVSTLPLAAGLLDAEQSKKLSPASDIPRISFTATARSLIQAAAAQVQTFVQPIASIQQVNRFPAGDGNPARFETGGTGTTLLQLKLMLDSVSYKVDTLVQVMVNALQAYSIALEEVHQVYQELPDSSLTSNQAQNVNASADQLPRQKRQPAPTPQQKQAVMAAHASGRLIDSLSEQMQNGYLAGGPRAQAHAQQQLHLFCCTIAPLLSNLNAWLIQGDDSELTDDFFIQKARRLDETSSLYWNFAFQLLHQPTSEANNPPSAAPGPSLTASMSFSGRLTASTDTNISTSTIFRQPANRQPLKVACPNFLQPFAQQIFTAGKALRLLRNSGTTGANNSGMTALLLKVPGLLLQPSAPTSKTQGPAILTSKTQNQGPSLHHQFHTALRNYLSHMLTTSTPSNVPGPVDRFTSEQRANGRLAGVNYERMAAAGHAMSSLQPWGAAGLPPAMWVPAWGTNDVQNTQDNDQHMHDNQEKQSALPAADVQPEKEKSNKTEGNVSHTVSTEMDTNTAALSSSLESQQPTSQSATNPSQSQDLSTHLNQANQGSNASQTTSNGQSDMQPNSWMSEAAAAMHAPVASLAWQGFQQHSREHGIQAKQEVSTSQPLNSRPAEEQQQDTTLQGNASLVPKKHPHRHLYWLLKEPCVAIPPLQQLLQQCLFHGIQKRMNEVEISLLSHLLSGWGLTSELLALRNLYLLASPAAQAWANHLLGAILDAEQLGEYELEMALQAACSEFADDADNALPALHSLNIVWGKGQEQARTRGLTARTATELASGTQGEAKVTPLGGLHSVVELESLEVHYQPSWLMSILGGTHALASYNKVLVFLLQINITRMALERTRSANLKFWQRQAHLSGKLTTHCRQEAAYTSPDTVVQPRPPGLSAFVLNSQLQSSWAQGATTATTATGASRVPSVQSVQLTQAQMQRHDQLALHEMFHFVINLHQYVVDRLLYGAWLRLEQKLGSVSSLEELVQAHQAFMADLEHQSGKAETGGAAGTWRHLVSAIIKILDQVIRYCAGQQMLMQQFESLAITSVQNVPGFEYKKGEADDQEKPIKFSQESVLLARQQMEDAYRSMRHLRAYLIKFITNKSSKLGADPELNNLVMRIEFNGWKSADNASAGL